MAKTASPRKAAESLAGRENNGPWRNRIVGYGEADPEQLLANESNWRIHPQEQQAALEGALDEVGWLQDIIINKRTSEAWAAAQGVETVLDGHLRVTLAMRHGQGVVPVKYVDLDPNEEALALATLDPISAMAVADKGQLEAILRQVETDNAAVQELMAKLANEAKIFMGGERKEAEPPQEDQGAVLQAKWRTARGQIWEISSSAIGGKPHRLMCGDSTSREDVAALMQGQRAALFATDPPYLVGYDGMNHPHTWNDPLAAQKNKDWSRSYGDVNWDESGDLDMELYDRFIEVAIDVAIRQDAAWYCWHASKRQADVEAAWERHGAFAHQQIIWVKDRAVLTRCYYMWQHEPLFFGWLKGHEPRRCADDYPSSVWHIGTSKPGEQRPHPTMKPVEGFAIPIRQHTLPGEICYEPFCGSGTQIVAAEQLGRLCYALDIEPKYIAVALERVSGLGMKCSLVAGELAPETSLPEPAEVNANG